MADAGPSRTFLLTAGGTGGHLFPALALMEVLRSRGHAAHVATDERVGQFISGIAADKVHVIRSASLAGGNPIRLVGGLARLLRGLAEARRLLLAVRPDLVVGFGGYPTIPPVLAARMLGIAALVHDQNAVAGRANRFLIRFGAELSTGFAQIGGGARARAVHPVGNPVRAAVREAAQKPYVPPVRDGEFHLLVFGGSQGARFFSELVPAALARLPKPQAARIRLVQQSRPEDLEQTQAALAGLNIANELAPFFDDMAARIADAHLVISRSGASTVSELAAIGRPAILVPYPYALDHDQAANAASLAAAGGAIVKEQAELDPEWLAAKIAMAMDDPTRLTAMAEAAKTVGEPNAVDKMADLVERMALRSGSVAGKQE